ncbi:MAG: NUDIX hydrolase [Actinomycetota bacterium]|nr:NUDIX hydrolase [Actinomycetota bacterium]
MRFRRRSDTPSEPEPDDSAWARPAGDDHSEDTEIPVPSPRERETIPEVAEEGFRPEAASVEPYEPVEESFLVEEPPAPPPDAPPAAPPEAPVRRWSGDRGGGEARAEGMVRAAGGVVWTRWRGGLRVVVVHRPRYDDWSLPKGKAGPGENDAECALREVREETGLACSLGEELGVATYYDRHGRLKTVRYFAMEPVGGGEGPHTEVDEVRWLGLEEAKRLLSYERDAEMLDALAAMASEWETPEEPPSP